MKHFITVFSLLVLLNSQLGGEVWQQGALALQHVKGKVTVTELGGESVVFRSIDNPVGLSGLMSARAAVGASVLFSTSNRQFLYLEGDGSFSIERFEQSLAEAEQTDSEDVESGQSRVIISFRKGDILMDARNMLDLSQLLVETPLGRLTAKKALWQMNVGYDPRSEIFDFTIACSSGQIRFTDLRGYVYTLRTGQRLSGAGARYTPSIEIGEMTRRSEEKMQVFQDLIASFDEASQDMSIYGEHLLTLGDMPTAETTVLPSQKRGSNHVPIVIEYTSDPTQVTPFRGEVKPPSKYQADLF